uniref:Solute carrier family 38, member 5a n=1 Tax=Nothobranchius korthausae TaxID=1143690 RepID=A0A1A8HIT5_9TELE
MELQKMNGHIRDDGFDGVDAMTEHEEFLPQKDGVKKEVQFTDFEGKTSFGMSVFNLSNAIMGSGILGLAFGMANTGVVLFVVLLCCIAVMSAYSIHLLLKSAGVVGIRAYEQLGNRAFGQPGKMLAACVITIHNIGAMSTYLYIVKSELPLVIQAFLGKQKFNIPCPLPGHNTTAPNSTSHVNVTCEAQPFTVNSETAYTIPILAFAFVCHPEVLPIYTELRNATKRRMQCVANVSILAMFVMYLLTAIFGYLTFYTAVEAELLHTYSKVDSLDILILCVRLAVLVAVTLTVPVVLFPIRKALLQIFFPDKPFHWVRHITIALSLIISVDLLVICVPSIKDIFGVIGATSAPSLIFILPAIFYIRIVPEEQESLRSRPKIQAMCFAALGFIFMILSLSFIIIGWVTGKSRSGGGH